MSKGAEGPVPHRADLQASMAVLADLYDDLLTLDWVQ
jgi:hypothetical protein